MIFEKDENIDFEKDENNVGCDSNDVPHEDTVENDVDDVSQNAEDTVGGDANIDPQNKYLEQLQRQMAEFDNYKKRTMKEKQELYTIITGEIISKFLPVIDNMENAIKAANDSNDGMVEGIKLITKQMKDVLLSFDVEEIVAVGQNFDPELHEAVMHIQDENYGENEVVEEFRKGYKCKNKVIRHSMVKVAN